MFEKEIGLNQKVLLAVFITVIVALFLVSNYWSVKADHKNINYKFKGVVESVTYDIKGTPSVKINGSEYYLSDNNWAFRHQIENGDSLLKDSGSMIIKLIKLKTRKIMAF